jgi:hypothetical protein
MAEIDDLKALLERLAKLRDAGHLSEGEHRALTFAVKELPPAQLLRSVARAPRLPDHSSHAPNRSEVLPQLRVGPRTL